MAVGEIVIGNICSLCAMVTDSISGTRKTTRQILAAQILLLHQLYRELFMRRINVERQGRNRKAG